MRTVNITKEDLSKMDPDLRDYYVAAARTRRRHRRITLVKRTIKGTVIAGAAAVIYNLGHNSEKK